MMYAVFYQLAICAYTNPAENTLQLSFLSLTLEIKQFFIQVICSLVVGEISDNLYDMFTCLESFSLCSSLSSITKLRAHNSLTEPEDMSLGLSTFSLV